MNEKVKMGKVKLGGEFYFCFGLTLTYMFLVIALAIIAKDNLDEVILLICLFTIGAVLFFCFTCAICSDAYKSREREYYYKLVMQKYQENITEINRIFRMYPESALDKWKENFKPDVSISAIRAKFYYNFKNRKCYFVINKSLWGDKSLFECINGDFILLAEEDAEMLIGTETIKVKDAEKSCNPEVVQAYVVKSMAKQVVCDRQFIEGKFNQCDRFLRENVEDCWVRMFEDCSLEFSELFHSNYL